MQSNLNSHAAAANRCLVNARRIWWEYKDAEAALACLSQRQQVSTNEGKLLHGIARSNPNDKQVGWVGLQSLANKMIRPRNLLPSRFTCM